MKRLSENEIKKRLPPGFENISFESEPFRDAYSAILAPENDAIRTVFVIGAGGCGKSVLYQIAAKSKKCLCMAPTGVAASNVKSETVEANTIHTALKLPVSDIYPMEIDPDILARLRGYEMALIDEVSMVNSNLFDFLMLHFSVAGMKVVFFGDPMQLEPTFKGWVYGQGRVTDTERFFTDDGPRNKARWNKAFPTVYRSLLFYDSIYYRMYLVSGLLETVFLSSVYRQKNAEYKEVLEAIRRGNLGEKERNYLRPYVRPPVPGAVVLAPTNEMVRRTNREEVRRYLDTVPAERRKALDFSAPAPLYRIDRRYVDGKSVPVILRLATDEYRETENFADRAEEAEYFIGERVMCTKNIFDAESRLLVPNGAVGTVLRFESSEVDELNESVKYTNEAFLMRDRAGTLFIPVPVVSFSVGGKTVEQKMDFAKYGMDYYDKTNHRYIQDARYYAVPLTEAYALTYHKSQGLTLEAAHLVVNEWVGTGNGMFYLGLSRVKDPAGLSLSEMPATATASRRSVDYLNGEDIWGVTAPKKGAPEAETPEHELGQEPATGDANDPC